MGHPRISIGTVWTERARPDWRCQSCRVAPPLNLPRLACPCAPIGGVQPLSSINATGVICSPPQLPEAQRSSLQAAPAHLRSKNAAGWNSPMRRCSFLRSGALRLPGVQGPAGLGRAWGQRAERSPVLSASGVIVDRRGSRSDRRQRGGHACSRRWTRG